MIKGFFDAIIKGKLPLTIVFGDIKETLIAVLIYNY